jgi:hypothetical protein
MTSRELRQGRERRRAPRGGRRPDDGTGFTPLVFLVDEDRSTSGDVGETLVATSLFAVARVDSVARVVTLVSTLLPDVIVARARDVGPLQRASSPHEVPLVAVTAELQENAALIHAIRTAVRTRIPGLTFRPSVDRTIRPLHAGQRIRLRAAEPPRSR